ncbi:MAG: four helix bundle protein [Nitrospira sp.]|nr:four helix bundle protein [Nitrospira sp.]
MADGIARLKIMPFRFESLEIWHAAREYARKVYVATGKFPRHEDYGLRPQMNRAANSISSNIAEGSAKDSDRAFDYQLEIAVGSTFEVAASFLACDSGYITSGEQADLYDHGQKLAKSINAFRHTLE